MIGKTVSHSRIIDPSNRMLPRNASAERDLAAIDEKIAQIRTNPPAEPQQQAMLREKARLERHVDEIDRMKVNSRMAKNLATSGNGYTCKIIDAASLPDRPISPTRFHILWMGIAAAMMVAVPAALIPKKAPRDPS
jgi:hypothetical protein